MGVNRPQYLNQLIGKMHNGMVKVVTGLRRSGKSYLLFNIFKDYLLSNGTEENQVIEIILDDDEFASLRNPLKLGECIRNRVQDLSKNYFILIDEIQYCKAVKNPDLPDDEITFYNVLNGILRRKNCDLYVTGSNSKMLSSDILTEFRGRGDQIHVYPLTFREYYDYAKDRIDFDEAFSEYATYGGLPYATLLKTDKEKSAYLKNLFEEVYLKDILQRNKIRNEEGLSDLLSVLASSVGSFTNPTKIENTFKSKGGIVYTSKTILNHLNIFADSFLISQAKRYDIKGRKYIGANSKYYFSDVGLRNAFLNFRQMEVTHITENIIYNELISRGYNVDVGIVEINEKDKANKSKRLQLEVDFVASMGNKKFYIQSAYSMPSAEKRNQEKRSFKNIDDSFARVIITRETAKAHYDDDGVYEVPLKDFLLTEDVLSKVP
ncbi:MAG: ATP-binding protein [Treponema sp.]|nr:ATP-binding protein [Treponema sp.]